VRWSYDLASRRLAEFCGLDVSDTTIREQTQVRRGNRMAGLCCLLYSDQWTTYWKSA
jgi:hypothetical protein